VENPEDLVKTLFAAIGTRDLGQLEKMVAEDVRFEAPYGSGTVVVGRQPLVEMFASILGGLFDHLHLQTTAVYPGLDPVVLIVEYESQATVLSTGRPYANRYIGVFRVRHGLLSFWREYFNPEILAAARQES
jgi:ketosteroid isomerase-like protein